MSEQNTNEINEETCDNDCGGACNGCHTNDTQEKNFHKIMQMFGMEKAYKPNKKVKFPEDFHVMAIRTTNASVTSMTLEEVKSYIDSLDPEDEDNIIGGMGFACNGKEYEVKNVDEFKMYDACKEIIDNLADVYKSEDERKTTLDLHISKYMGPRPRKKDDQLEAKAEMLNMLLTLKNGGTSNNGGGVMMFSPGQPGSERSLPNGSAITVGTDGSTNIDNIPVVVGLKKHEKKVCEYPTCASIAITIRQGDVEYDEEQNTFERAYNRIKALRSNSTLFGGMLVRGEDGRTITFASIEHASTVLTILANADVDLDTKTGLLDMLYSN